MIIDEVPAWSDAAGGALIPLNVLKRLACGRRPGQLEKERGI